MKLASRDQVEAAKGLGITVSHLSFEEARELIKLTRLRKGAIAFKKLLNEGLKPNRKLRRKSDGRIVTVKRFTSPEESLVSGFQIREDRGFYRFADLNGECPWELLMAQDSDEAVA